MMARGEMCRFCQVSSRLNCSDLFDLAVVIREEPASLVDASPFLLRHRTAFLAQLDTRKDILQKVFEQIDVLDFEASFEDCVGIVSDFLSGLPRTGLSQ